MNPFSSKKLLKATNSPSSVERSGDNKHVSSLHIFALLVYENLEGHGFLKLSLADSPLVFEWGDGGRGKEGSWPRIELHQRIALVLHSRQDAGSSLCIPSILRPKALSHWNIGNAIGRVKYYPLPKNHALFLCLWSLPYIGHWCKVWVCNAGVLNQVIAWNHLRTS